VVIAQERPVTSRRRRNGRLDRGAAAVEMALVMPLLIAMIIGIIDFSRIFNGQIQLSQAAREGARIAALGTPGGFTIADVTTRTTAALPNPALEGAVTVSTSVSVVDINGALVAAGVVCVDSNNYSQVTVSIPYQKIWWGPTTLTQRASMKCAG
jgi:Flp pilus assembly protein TadG